MELWNHTGYLITELTSLQYLSTLDFTGLSNLTDTAFKNECLNRFFTINGSPKLAPAICCFNELTHLRILACHLLTDDCIINGVAKCKTLKNIRIGGGCDGISSQKCCELVNCEVYYVDSESRYRNSKVQGGGGSIANSDWNTAKFCCVTENVKMNC